MKRGIVAGFLFALVAGVGALSLSSTIDMHRYSSQHALNKMLNERPTEYTLQEALNIIAQTPAERDTLVTLFTWIFDDGSKNLWNATAWADSFTAYDQVATVSVIAHNALYGDTTNTTLSPARLRALEARGWDIQGHGYTHGDSLWASSGAYAMCQGQTNRTQYMREWTRCMAAFDTLGLRPPRGFSWPWSGGNQIAKEEATKAGFDYGFASAQTATNGIRYCYPVEVERIFGSRYIAAYPGILPDRYEIGQCIGDANNYSTFRASVRRGIKARGSWIVYIGHSPQAWESTTGHQFEEALGFIDSLRTLGLLRVVTAREGYELMFETPIGPSANFMYPNLPDVDADNQPDFVNSVRDSMEIGLGANTFTSAGTRDSVFVSASRPNHGVMGCGYILTANNGYYEKGDVAGYTSAGKQYTQSYYSRDFQFRFPNAWRGRRVTFEFWAQVDMRRHRAALTTADTIGVTFEARREGTWGRYGTTSLPQAVQSTDEAGGYATNVSGADYIYWAASSAQLGWPSHSTFAATDTVGGTWKHVQGTWVVPPWADYLFVNIVQDSGFKNKAVRLSNFSITRQPATDGQTW